MNTQLSADEMALLTDALESEGRPRFSFGGEADLVGYAAIPAVWKEILGSGDERVATALKQWDHVASLVPQTRRLLHSKLLDVALLVVESKPASLVYFFREDSEILGHRGFAPIDEASMQRVPAEMRPLIEPFYRLHDGWVDLFGGDGGPLPVAEWQRIPADEATSSAALLTVFSSGSHQIGFELLRTGVRIHALWPDDEEVREVQDFWAAVDEEMALNLEDCTAIR